MAITNQTAGIIRVCIRRNYNHVHGQLRRSVSARRHRHRCCSHLSAQKTEPAYDLGGSVDPFERVLGLYAHILVALIALAIAKSGVVAIPEKLSWGIVLLFLLYTVGFAISFAPWAEGLLETCSKRFPHLRYLHKALAGVKSYRLYRNNKSTLITFFALSMLEVVVVTLSFYFAAEAMALKISLLQLLVSVPLILILARIPVSVSGIGVFEAVVALFFVQFGESISHATIYGFLLRILQLFVLLPGGFLYLMEKPRTRRDNSGEMPLSLAGESK